MPIRWNALKVSEAVDQVEQQVALAESFLVEARAKAEEARRIPNLPQYIDQRLCYLIDRIDRVQRVREAIASVRRSIPAGAVELEREKAKDGNQLSLIES